MILVTGASGSLGRLVVNRLVGRGATVVAGTRTPERLTADLPAQVGVRAMDFDDPSGLVAGFTGANVVLLISAGYAEADTVIARHSAAIDAAAAAGVRHIVYTSLTRAGDHLTYALPHRCTERRLAAGPTAWTVLRNGLYAELLIADTTRAAADGVLTAPLGTGRIAVVARDDLADAAARVLIEADADPHGASTARHAGRVYDLVGDHAIGGEELATAASHVAGSPVAYQPGTLAELRGALADAGLPAWQVENIVSTYAVAAAGFLAGTESTLTDLLGTTPRSAIDLITTAADRTRAVR